MQSAFVASLAHPLFLSIPVLHGGGWLAGCSRSLRVSLLVVPTAASGTNIAARWLLVRQRDRVQGVPVRFLSKVE